MDANTTETATGEERDFGLSVRNLLHNSAAILRKFDPYALAAGVISAVIFAGWLNIHPLISLVLGALVYVGFTLVRPHPPARSAPPPPPTPEEVAFGQARATNAHILDLSQKLRKPEVILGVNAVSGKFAKMLNVMEEDSKLGPVSDYYGKLIRPFDRMLGEYERLARREVPAAQDQLDYFETHTVPRTETVAEAFYQEYHHDGVENLAALIEIHGLNLDSLDPKDEDAGDPESDLEEENER